MADFFISQIDYILFFYGFAFFMLGTVSFILMKEKPHVLPWTWLGLFGIAHGTYEWLNLLAVSFGDNSYLKIVRILFLIISYMFLAEFGRAGVFSLRGGGMGRWVFVPLLALALTGGFAGVNGIDAFSRYTLALTGGLWAARALFLASKGLEMCARRWLIFGSVSLTAYALATGLIVAGADFFPASLLNNDVFLQSFGVPVELMRGIIAVFIALSVWAYSQVGPVDEFRLKKRCICLPVVVILIVLALGWGWTLFAGSHAKDVAIKTAMPFADTLSIVTVYRLFAIFTTFVFCSLTVIFFSILYFTKKSAAQIASSERALRASEEKFRNIFEDSPIGIEIYDSEGTLLDANRACLDIFSISDIEDVRGFKLFEDPNVSDDVKKKLLGGETVRYETTFDFNRVAELKLYNTSRAGQIYINVVLTPVGHEAKDRFSGYLVQVQDITEQKNAEAEAIHAGHLAAIGELAAGVAHEINNPINGIINYAQILVNKLDRGTTESDISERIIKESNRIAGIVKNLLSFSRQRKDEKKPADLREILSDSLALTGTQLQKERIKLKMDVPSGPFESTVNPQQIQQVFLNVLSNARYALNQKYPSAHEDKIIEITAREVTLDDKPFNRVVFHDHGTGISRSMIDKVVKPFITTKPEGAGTGLGLSISHDIIKDHGGDLTIESSEGEFTRVTIDLPSGRRESVS
ncbi:MAG: PAS domain S-box protein [Nitrospiraceae bacterium]|nr:MAG: PAS domain S-box protein [Nitrospiraceae bacterium]